MARTISVGAQDFGTLREKGYFYIDKTAFIREWWKVRGCGYVDYASAPFWQNTEHEHGRVLFFQSICR